MKTKRKIHFVLEVPDVLRYVYTIYVNKKRVYDCVFNKKFFKEITEKDIENNIPIFIDFASKMSKILIDMNINTSFLTSDNIKMT